MPQPELDRRVFERLSSEGVRYTAGRRAVIEALRVATGPQSAAELQLAVGSSLPLSSLYRTLMVLEEVGVLVDHFSTKGVARYEMAEWLSGHHHHLVCVACGLVEDIEIADGHEKMLHQMVIEVASGFGFSVAGHALEIQGQCRDCSLTR